MKRLVFTYLVLLVTVVVSLSACGKSPVSSPYQRVYWEGTCEGGTMVSIDKPQDCHMSGRFCIVHQSDGTYTANDFPVALTCTTSN